MHALAVYHTTDSQQRQAPDRRDSSTVFGPDIEIFNGRPGLDECE